MITVFNAGGQIIQTMYRGNFKKGEHIFYWNSEDLPAGNYYIRYQSGSLQQVKLISKVR
ncbi:MAG: hypothetical protein ABIR66_05515 [Saprospiraceae bacterium]